MPTTLDPTVSHPNLANEDAEKALLATALENNAVITRVWDFLRPEHFTRSVHAEIYISLTKAVADGRSVGIAEIRLIRVLDGDNVETAQLDDLVNSAVAPDQAEQCGRRIHELWLRRQIMALTAYIADSALSPDRSPMDVIGDAECRLYDLASCAQTDRGLEAFEGAVSKAVRQAEAARKCQGKPSGLPTGFTDLDRMLGGLQPSHLLIIAGRNSMGTTALATNIAVNAARAYRDGTAVAFFSLELSAEQLAVRILAEQAEIASLKIRQGDLNDHEFESLTATAENIRGLPLFIDDTPALSISALRTRARRLNRQHGLGLIIVDHLQLLRGWSGHAETREQEVSEIMCGLKLVAKELNLPVIALSKLPSAVEQRDDKRPQLSDLREFGAIEQDADVVMFVFREQHYLERAEPARGTDEDETEFSIRHCRWLQHCEEVRNIADVIIAKHRHGPVGTVRLSFNGELAKFRDLAGISMEPRPI